MINLSDPRDEAGYAMLIISWFHFSFHLCYSAIVLCELAQWYVKCFANKPAHTEYLLLGRLDFDVHILDTDGAILSSRVRVELRDNTNKLVASKLIGIDDEYA